MSKRIGVDLDGTLATKFDEEYNPGIIGDPVAPMVEQVKRWLAEGHDVVVFTARVSPSNAESEIKIARDAIGRWCRLVFGRELEITSDKDFRMSELWDDRARQVVTNTGLPAVPVEGWGASDWTGGMLE